MDNICSAKKMRGFTVVELLVVVVIIGILAAVTLVGYTGITQRAAAAVQTDLKNASTQIELFKTENDGEYPDKTEDAAFIASLPKSGDTLYQYDVVDGQYYLSATTPSNTSIAYYISSTSGAVITGVWENHNSGVVLTWKQISAGAKHNCAIASNDKAYCWGDNSNGQLGDNSNTNRLKPVAVNEGEFSGKTVKYISASSNNTCVIASDDNAYCWGSNAYGQLGNNSNDASSLTPVAVDTSGVLSGKTIKSLFVGPWHTCAIASDDNSYCWGDGENGRLGNNSTNAINRSPVAVSLSGKTITSMSMGSANTCALASDGSASCWGLNNYGQLGTTSSSPSQILVPVAVTSSGLLTGKTIKSITSGNTYTCVIASDDKAYCWGWNGYGQLGDASNTDRLNPVSVTADIAVLADKTLKSIKASNNHTCVIASDDKAYCWGSGDNGQLGNNEPYASSIPVVVNTSGVLSGKTINSITTGAFHTCAIASDNQVYCWGQNGFDMMGDITIFGQLGINDSNVVQSAVPVVVSQP